MSGFILVYKVDIQAAIQIVGILIYLLEQMKKISTQIMILFQVQIYIFICFSAFVSFQKRKIEFSQ